MLINKPRIIKFNENGDFRGKLISLENFSTVPFEIKRIFYIYSTQKDISRGNHANYKSEFLIISLVGNCKIKYFFDGKFSIKTLSKNNYGLYLPKLIWKEMYDFSEDSVLLILSNTLYNNNDYINDFSFYKKLISK
jgi:dTDP-4-dehydrorhamnose 3,5-epimerase-like enzyme